MFKKRTAILGAAALLVFAVLLARLLRLQTVEAPALADELSEHRVRVGVVVPARGRILDRHGRVLAEDRDSHDLWLVPVERERRGRRYVDVSRLAPLDVERLLALGRAEGPLREAELAVASDLLARENALVARLADALPPPLGHRDPNSPDIAPPHPRQVEAARARVARLMLTAALRRRPGTMEGLRETVRFVDDVDFAVYDEILQHQAAGGHPDFAAVAPRLGKVRVYPQGACAAQLVGYLSELEPEEYRLLRGAWVDGEDEPVAGRGYLRGNGRVVFSVLPAPEDPLDLPTDEATLLAPRLRRTGGRVERVAGFLPEARVGRAGLEQHYNEWLRGRHVTRPWWYDRRSPDGPRERIPLGPEKPPRDGRDLHLSIDLVLQRRVEDILGAAVRELSGLPENADLPVAASAVVMDPHSGRLHALASYPGYDPNYLGRDFARLAADPARPMRHHAVGEHFPPGSVLKPFVGLAALEDGAWGPDDLHDCKGVIKIGRRAYRCMKRSGHGPLDLRHALMYSCNTMFYHLGEIMRSRTLYQHLERFGFGRRTGVDLAGEAPGMLPRAAFTGRGFSLGELYHLSIGQNKIVTTPLQVAAAYAALANADANGARLVRPHLAIPGPDGSVPDPRLDQPRAEFMVDRRALRVVRDGLYAVVQGDGVDAGSGRSAAFIERMGDYGLELAGKTGSAELDAVRPGSLSKKYSHAWFAAYAPFDRPEVVVVVMVEYGDLGGRTSGPLVKRILRAFFEETHPDWVMERGVG